VLDSHTISRLHYTKASELSYIVKPILPPQSPNLSFETNRIHSTTKAPAVMGSSGFFNFVQRVCPCMNNGEGGSDDGRGASNDDQGALNDGQGASNDSQGGLNDSHGASNDSQGASNNGQGASNDSQGASNDSQGALDDGQGTLSDSQGASTRPQPISIDRTPSPPAGG
jgi:hypothetical protein